MHWNLAGFAQTLIPLIDSDAVQSLEMAQDMINTFPAKFEAAYNAGIREKLGFQSSKEEDPFLMADRLTVMADHQADFTLGLGRLRLIEMDNSSADGVVRALFDDPVALTNGQRVGELDWVMKSVGSRGGNNECSLLIRSISPEITG